MLIKLIKYDFKFSAKLLLMLGGIGLVLAMLLGGYDRMYTGRRIMLAGEYQSMIFTPHSGFMGLVSLAMVPVLIAAAIHLAQFYHKSMFGRAGHLAMTMPISRGKLLLSKLVVSFVWLLYAIAVALAMVAITHIISPWLELSNFFVFIDIGTIEIIISTAFLCMAAICLLYFCITLANSVVAGKRLNIWISGVIGFVIGFACISIAGRITARAMLVETNMIYGPDGVAWGEHTIVSTLMGWQYGRPVIGQRPWGGDVYLDIYAMAFLLVVAVILAIATRFLLDNRVSI